MNTTEGGESERQVEEEVSEEEGKAEKDLNQMWEEIKLMGDKWGVRTYSTNL